ncbi:MAG: hypothetical protein IMZ64_13400 [Bacteroidetes bacterium]|nr:hypothetical protein [Bacteroidota bacterium]
MKKELTDRFSVAMPHGLKLRIDELAKKGLTTRNHWIVRTLKRESGYND